MELLKSPRTIFVIGLLLLTIGVSILALGLTSEVSRWEYPGYVYSRGNPTLISVGAGLTVIGIGISTGSVIWRKRD